MSVSAPQLIQKGKIHTRTWPSKILQLKEMTRTRTKRGAPVTKFESRFKWDILLPASFQSTVKGELPAQAGSEPFQRSKGLEVDF